MAVVESLLPLIRRDVPNSRHSVAFIDSNVEEILKEAKASTQRFKDGTSLGIMDGIPTAIKDETDVAGYRTRSGRKQNDQVFKIAEKSSNRAISDKKSSHPTLKNAPKSIKKKEKA